MTKSMTHADGWAVVDDRGLDIRTVSGARREAIVEWLIVNHIVKFDFERTDDEVEYLWIRHAVNPNRANVFRVTVDVT